MILSFLAKVPEPRSRSVYTSVSGPEPALCPDDRCGAEDQPALGDAGDAVESGHWYRGLSVLPVSGEQAPWLPFFPGESARAGGTGPKVPQPHGLRLLVVLNNPSLVEEITRMRMELLGTSFIPQHSDARVLTSRSISGTTPRRLLPRYWWINIVIC